MSLKPLSSLRSSAFLVLALLSACSTGGADPQPAADPASADGEMRVEGLGSGTFGQKTTADRRIIRTADELQEHWPARGVPRRVDFEQHMVVLVALGERPTGGYFVEITSVRLTGDTLRVRYRESVPSPDCNVIQQVTAPYHGVVVDKVEVATVLFEGEMEEAGC